MAPQQLRVKELGHNYVTLEWEPVDGAGVDGYEVTYSDMAFMRCPSGLFYAVETTIHCSAFTMWIYRLRAHKHHFQLCT